MENGLCTGGQPDTAVWIGSVIFAVSHSGQHFFNNDARLIISAAYLQKNL